MYIVCEKGDFVAGRPLKLEGPAGHRLTVVLQPSGIVRLVAPAQIPTSTSPKEQSDLFFM